MGRTIRTPERQVMKNEAKRLYAGGKTYTEIEAIFKKKGYKNSNGNYFNNGGIYFLINGTNSRRKKTTRGVAPVSGGSDVGFLTFFKGVSALPVDDATKWAIVSLGVEA